MVLFQKWKVVCSEKMLLRDRFLNDGSQNRRFLVSNELLLSLAGVVLLFKEIKKKCSYLSGGLLISRKLYWNLPLSKRNPPLFLRINRAQLLLQPSYKQSLGFPPRASSELWLSH